MLLAWIAIGAYGVMVLLLAYLDESRRAGERLRPTSPASTDAQRDTKPGSDICRIHGCWRRQATGHLLCEYHMLRETYVTEVPG